MSINIPEKICLGSNTEWSFSPFKFDSDLIKLGSAISWQGIVLSGIGALTLSNALANGINYLKLFGGTEQLSETYIDSVTAEGKCEQTGTPTPSSPMDIVCNNGVIKVRNKSGLPWGYTLLDYIETSGTQYINPQVSGNARWVITAQTNTVKGSSQSLISSTSGASGGTWYGEFTNTGHWDVISGGTDIPPTTKTTADLTFDSSGVRGTIGSTSVNRVATVTQSTWRIFGTTDGSYPFAGKLFDAKVYQNGALVRNFIPAKNSSNVIGLYDLVSGTFFTNDGTGTFTAGNPVDDLEIYTDGTVEQVTDSVGNTASAERLLAVDDFKDTQEVLSGSVTRNIGIKIMTGDENFQSGTNGWISENAITDQYDSRITLYAPLCTHFIGTSDTPTSDNQVRVYLTSTGTPRVYFGCNKTIYDTADTFKQFFKDQYANGTPVIIVYPTSSATTESVSGQFLSKSPVTQTAGAISNLGIAVTSSSHITPTPQQPLQINCNNGVLKLSPNLFDSTVNKAFVKENTEYTISLTKEAVRVNILAYDSDDNNLGTVATWPSNTIGYKEATFITPANTKYLTNSALQSCTNVQIELGSTATTYRPYGQIYTDGTVETVEITGKNLFDKNHLPERIYAYFANSGTSWLYASSGYSLRFPCLPNTTYTARYNGNSTQTVLSFASTSNDTVPTSGQTSVTVTQAIRQNTPTINTPVTLTTGANDKWLIVQYNAVEPENTNMADNLQIELGSTATTYENYYNGGSATAEMLLAISSYQDVQSVLDGEVTRNVGIKVLDGTEEYTYTEPNTYGIANITSTITGKVDGNTNLFMCSHFVPQTTSWSLTQTEGILNGNNNNQVFFRVLGTRIPSLSAWKQYLADQYNSGNPVVIVYPLATATTESVTAQPLTIQEGTNIVEITQSSMDNLGLEVSYKGTN